jgi:hypothetical protein
VGDIRTAAHGGRKSQLRRSGTGRRSLRLGCLGGCCCDCGADAIRIDRSAVRGWRNAQREFWRSRSVAAIARHWWSEERNGRGRHGEVVLPLPRQKQLVGISQGSQIGDV